MGDEPHPTQAEPIRLAVTDELDLHAFAPQDVTSLVEEYLGLCRAQGLHRVRLIHGRGKGHQRASVRRLLQRLPAVSGLEDAPPELGGWGATIVSLAP